MGSHTNSPLVTLIINTLYGTPGGKKGVLMRLLEFHREYLSDEEVFELIDHYKRQSEVIEAVLASGVLSESSAYRMLRVFPTKKRWRTIVDMTYEHLRCMDGYIENYAISGVIDGRTIETRA